MPQQGFTAWMNQQAQSLAPRTEMDGSTPEEQMASQMGNIPTMTKEQVKQGVASGQLDPSQPVRVVKRSQASLKTQQSMNDPELAQMVQKANQQADAAFLTQRQGLSQLEDNINEMRKEKSGGIDYTPFVAMSKFLNPSMDTQSMEQAAAALRPESTSMKNEKLLRLQDMLQQRKNDMSKQQLDSLKEQIAMYKASKVDPLDRELKLSRVRANDAISGTKADGKILPEASVQKLSDFDAGLKELNDMAENFDKYKDTMGPTTGRLSAMNPFNTHAQSFQSDIDRARQVIGKAVEGGVLRKEDEAKYMKMLPVLSDTPEVAKYKMKQFANKLSAQRNNYLGNMQNAGYNTKNVQMVEQQRGGNEPASLDSLDADLESMTPEQLKQYIDTHGG